MRRNISVFIACGFLFLWGDLAVAHLSANLRHPIMWLPLLFLPLAALVLLQLHFRNSPDSSPRYLKSVSIGATLLGLLGFFMHVLAFVRNLEGALQWEIIAQFMRYPPLFAPLSISGLGFLGMLILEKKKT